MIKKIFTIIIAIVILLTLSISYLAYFGIETSKFNSIIKDKIKNQNSQIDIDLNKANLYLDLKNLSIRIITKNPKLIFNNSKKIELEEVSSNISILSYVQNKFSIKNLSVKSKNNEIKDFIDLYRLMNNSTQLIFINQIIKGGDIELAAHFNFDQSGKINNDYKITGNVTNIELGLLKLKNIRELKLNFEIENKKYNFKKILFKFNETEFNSDFLNIKKKNKSFFIEGNIKNEKNKIDKELLVLLFNNNLSNLDFENSKFDSVSEFSFYINKKFKIQNLKINSKLNIDNLAFKHNFDKLKNYITEYKDSIKLKENKFNVQYSANKIKVDGSSELYFKEDIKNLASYNILKDKNKLSFETLLNLTNTDILFDDLSYHKKIGKEATLKIIGSKNKNKILLNNINFIEDKNKINIKNLKIENNKILNLDKIKFDYITKNNFKNHLSLIKKNNNYELFGEAFDSEVLIDNILNSNSNSNFFDIFYDLNSKIKINIKKIKLDKENEINNLKGFLKVKNNKIFDLNLNSNFSNEEKIFLTIKSEKDNKTITNFYSHRAKPFVKKYKFIKEFEEGNIVYHSTKINNVSKSRLIIDNFKVKEVPVLAKLLTLASLQGISDLLTGEGIRFTDFEMTYSKNNSLMTIDEIYAIGPAISIMMNGYVESEKLVSLRGTLVPATTINRTIASIPLLGDILIGKKIGEGVFGISFKIKGSANDLRTTVNPIKTLTPRFITRTLEKIKKN